MYKFCVFAGTTEGREIVDFLCDAGAGVTACVATEYGETLLTQRDGLTVSAKRMTEEEMEEMLSKEHFDLVIDATHPYAQVVTENINKAAQATGTEYLRLLRESSSVSGEAVYVSSIPEAVEYLNAKQGTILLTTGSKELMGFTEIEGFSERVYARVLPMQSSLDACSEAGLKASRIIAMQGPFTEDMNTAMLKFTGASFLVTKDGGDKGGFKEKADAAAKSGTTLVVIGRPKQLQGMSLTETTHFLSEKYGLSHVPFVTIAGIGPGSKESMTGAVRTAVSGAQCLIGAKRMLEAVAGPGQILVDAISPDKISAYIKEHKEYRKFAVIMSGDTGFFSGTKKLLPLLEGCSVEVLPGISSLVYLCSKVRTSYEDVKIVSLHGRDHDIVRDVKEERRVFALVGGENGIAVMCQKIADAGLGYVRVSVGQRLSYPDEKIVTGTAEELAKGYFDSLSVALIENDRPQRAVSYGLPDLSFQRGEGADGVVPMTKSEVRAVCLSKLSLMEDSVCWDVGAGTGSVSVEMALMARKGHVYAIEKKEDAAELLVHNKEKFGAENFTAVKGLAPEACEDLPAPDRVFIGGSSGNMEEIISLVLSKNPNARIVATAIALESVSELTACLKKFNFSQTEVVSMQVAKDRKAGSYHLMTANNPIYIFTMQA